MDAINLFAILELERDPLRFAEFGRYLRNWLEDAGGFAAIGLIAFLLATKTGADSAWATDQTRKRTHWPMVLCAILALIAYAAAAFFFFQEPPLLEKPDPYNPLYPRYERQESVAGKYKDICMILAGGLSLVGFCLPFFVDLLSLKWRRVGALARLSFREAIRRKILWVFLAILLLFMFPSKWFVRIKQEDEIRNAVAVVEFATSVVMLFAFSLLAAISIPGDIRSQSLHTVVTKPVQRFEIVLGRFVGYLSLATVVLIALRLFSMLMIWASNPDDAAKVESQQARQAVYADLEFYKGRTRFDRGVEIFNKITKFEGESVGREWDYRKYIAGHEASPHRALFNFNTLPGDLANREVVNCEFAFDIFRTTKGDRENVGVQVSLFFVTAGWSDARIPDYKAEMERLGLKSGSHPTPGTPEWDKWNQLTEKFGYYEYKSRAIADYHTYQVPVPGGIFKSALNAKATDEQPPLVVQVKCESRTQFIGVAKRDLFLLEGNGNFWWNYLKGAFGLWLLLALVIGLTVVLSTYLSGIISWLLTLFILVWGIFREFVQEVAEGRAVGGGPIEAFIKLATNKALITELEPSAGTAVMNVGDTGYQWLMRKVLNLFPDVERFDWSAYVAEGFYIPFTDMAISFVMLVGYLLPWFVVGYYLMKSREVAN